MGDRRVRLIDFFDRGVAKFPDRICLKDDHASWTYTEVQCMTYQAARAMGHAGVGPGERIAVYSPNGAAAFAAVLGIFRAGCVWLPVNARNVLAETIEYLRGNGCTGLFFGDRHRTDALAIAAAIPGLKVVVSVDAAEGETPVFSAGSSTWTTAKS